ncbi:hypothetical protein GCM10009787_56840 [Streptomyces bangladeshensis]|uniref:Uncharacterized protein n=1 Tax=Streptomyces bangladeshensis TaxID=295352 RepID=A0ABP5NSI3_9ACTN
MSAGDSCPAPGRQDIGERSLTIRAGPRVQREVGYQCADNGHIEAEHREDSLQRVDQTAQIGAVDAIETVRFVGRGAPLCRLLGRVLRWLRRVVLSDHRQQGGRGRRAETLAGLAGEWRERGGA